jgi:hypothetical protein
VHLSHPIGLGKRQDHFADDFALGSGELQKASKFLSWYNPNVHPAKP